MPTTPQAHLVFPEAATIPCSELAEAISRARGRLNEIAIEISDATEARDAFDTEADQWHALEHAAQLSAIEDIKHLSGKANDPWAGALQVDNAAVAQAHAGEAAARAKADDEWAKIKQLHDEQSWLRAWCTAADYESRSRCGAVPPTPEPKVGKKIVKAAAVLLATAMTVGIGTVWRHVAAGPQPERTDLVVSQPSPTPADHPDAPPATISGHYAGDVIVDKDPAGHSCCIKPASDWDVLQKRDKSTGAITIEISGVLPGLVLSAPLQATGDEFHATTFASVAGANHVQIDLVGRVTFDDGLAATLTFGANRVLPQGKAITFIASMVKIPTPMVEVVPV
jgi:hypothetical protein